MIGSPAGARIGRLLNPANPCPLPYPYIRIRRFQSFGKKSRSETKAIAKYNQNV